MIRVNQIKLPYNHTKEDLIKAIAKVLKIKNSMVEDAGYEIVKRSVDSRKKPDIYYVYAIDITLPNENSISKQVNSNNVMLIAKQEYELHFTKDIKVATPPVIVGMGPAGLFCGLYLAKAGLNPIIIERGDCVEKRIDKVQKFWNDNVLDTESNVQFGEGGAGTFSDGKLNTMVKDPVGRIRYVLKTFVEYGADSSILYVNKPHIGTDVLCNIVKNIRNEIISLGGTVLFNTKLTDINIKNNKVESIVVNDSQVIPCEKLVLAIGHSARDTFALLKEKNLDMKAKSFAVGVRIEHPQELINNNSYGIDSLNLPEGLPVADYKVTHQCSNGRGVYSFCMCPGGYVVNASSEEKRLAVNGMSYSKRDSKNANTALIVTVTPEDFGNDPMAGVEFQRKLESKAYELGKGNIPVQLYGDYRENRISTDLGKVTPCIKGNWEFSDLNELFPEYINESLKEGIESFGKQIPGYNMPDAVLAGIESRTSSPVRIIRDDETYESNIEGIYPCAEGAGYAGGITSACVDGIRVAEKLYQHL